MLTTPVTIVTTIDPKGNHHQFPVSRADVPEMVAIVNNDEHTVTDVRRYATQRALATMVSPAQCSALRSLRRNLQSH